jgi:receptor expression-enhancing protein 5/6
MALLGSALGGEVGLRLLLSPATSHVIVRTACTVVGIGFPVYSTHKAIERKSPAEQEQWLVYWAGQFSIIFLPSITS